MMPPSKSDAAMILMHVDAPPKACAVQAERFFAGVVARQRGAARIWRRRPRFNLTRTTGSGV